MPRGTCREPADPDHHADGKGREIDKVLGLELGADDYVTKPFSTREILARVKAHLRRQQKPDNSADNTGGTSAGGQGLRLFELFIDTDMYMVYKSGEALDLTHREYELVYYLARNAGKVMTREHLSQAVWGFEYFGDVRTVDVTIRRLREKIEENPSKPEYILTRRGLGYLMRALKRRLVMKWLSFFRTIQAKVIIIYVLLILIAMRLIGVYFVSAMKNSLTSNFTKDLQERAELMSVLAAKTLGGENVTEEDPYDSLRVMVNNLFNLNGAEIQVLDSTGRVLTTSPSHADYVNTKNTQTVVSRALQGIQDNEEYIIDDDNIRKSGGQARHVQRENRRRDLYRSQHERAVQHDATDQQYFISGILLALGLTAVLGVILSHTITNPIKELTKHAGRRGRPVYRKRRCSAAMRSASSARRSTI